MKAGALVLLLLGLAACRGSFRDDDALVDCDVRARAAAGEYVANFQLCLEDRHHVDPTGASDVASAFGSWRLAVAEDSGSRLRDARFNLYAAQLRMARFHDVDSAWVSRRIASDSARLQRAP